MKLYRLYPHLDWLMYLALLAACVVMAHSVR